MREVEAQLEERFGSRRPMKFNPNDYSMEEFYCGEDFGHGNYHTDELGVAKMHHHVSKLFPGDIRCVPPGEAA